MIDVIRDWFHGWRTSDFAGYAALLLITWFLYLFINAGRVDCAVLCG